MLLIQEYTDDERVSRMLFSILKLKPLSYSQMCDQSD